VAKISIDTYIYLAGKVLPIESDAKRVNAREILASSPGYKAVP